MEITRRTRIPASDILHKFLVHEDECQVRGVPWGHTAMLDLHMVKGYTDAEVVSARIGASKMGFFIPPAGDEFAGDVDENGNAPDKPELMTDVQPGVLDEIPPGYDFKTFDPQHPNSNVSAFVKVMLRSVAAGLDVAYTTLANDLEGVNFSSIRAGLLEERDIWRGLQAFMVMHFCRPVFQGWLKSAMLSGALNLRTRDYERLKEAKWMPRGWTWVDPLKDIQAAVMAINNGLGTRTKFDAENGEDFEEIVMTLAAEIKLAKEMGVDFTSEKPVSGTVKPVDEPTDDSSDNNNNN
jgi:lambda family phage portal protein